MRVVHELSEGPRRTLATDVETADSWLARGLGLIGRRSIPDDYALVFPFGRATRRGIHTVGVRVPIDVVWSVDDAVTRVETLPAWRGVASARADRVVEFPAGAADGVGVGDRILVIDA